MPTITKAYGSIVELGVDLKSVTLVTNINPYNCSIFDLKSYVHVLADDEKFSPPKQFLFYGTPGGTSGGTPGGAHVVTPIGTTVAFGGPEYNLGTLNELRSDDFENFSTDFSVVPGNLKVLNVISFDDFFDPKELHQAKKHQYGNIKLFFPIIYNILTTFLNGEYKKTYGYLFLDKGVTAYSIRQNQEFFEIAAQSDGSKGGVTSRLKNVNILIPITGTQKKVVNCRNVFDLLSLTTTPGSKASREKGTPKGVSVPYVKLISKTNGKFYTALRERTDVPSQIRKIDDKIAKQLFNRLEFTEMVQFRVEKPDYYYNVYIDERGNFVLSIFFSDANFFSFPLLDIVAKEEYRFLLGLLESELISPYLATQSKALLKRFGFTIRSSLVEFTFEDPEVNIENFLEAMGETEIETDIIGVDAGNYYVKKGLSTMSPQVPYSTMVVRFDYETKIADLRKQSAISLEYLNRLTLNIANVKNVEEEEYAKRLFQAIASRTSNEVAISSGSNIKKLRSADPKTFKPANADFVYSKGCQKKRQPVYIEDGTYAALSPAERERVVEIRNHTTGGTSLYFCPTEEFPHLNFITGHPDSFCAPCCQVKKELPEVLEGCKATGFLSTEKRKSKKSSSYAYIPTAGNNVERTRIYNIPTFTETFELRGVALDRKVGNFPIPSFDAMTIYFGKDPEEFALLEETPKALADAFTPGNLTDANNPLMGQHVDTLWTRLGVTPIYVFAGTEELAVKTVPSENENYIVIYKSSAVKGKRSMTAKAQAKEKVKTETAGGALGENYFLVTRETTPYFGDVAACTFGPEDDLIKLIFAGKRESSKTILGLAELEQHQAVSYQVVDHQDKAIGVVLRSGEFISVTKSFPSSKLEKVTAGAAPPSREAAPPSREAAPPSRKAAPTGTVPTPFFVRYKTLRKILEDLEFPSKRIVFDGAVIGLRVGDLDVYCSDGPTIPPGTAPGTVTVGYNIRSFFETVLWGDGLSLMTPLPVEAETRAKEALYKKYVYSIILLQIAENASLKLPETLEETKEVLGEVVVFTKKPQAFPVENMLRSCPVGNPAGAGAAEYCASGKVIVDSRFREELSKLIFYDITNNNVIQYIRENINNFKIINRYRFTKRVNERITFYEME